MSTIPDASVDAINVFKNTLIPTGKIFHAGSSSHGSCFLGKKWEESLETKLFTTHNKESNVTDADIKRVSRSDAVVYNFRIYPSHAGSQNRSLLQGNNQYITRFFPTVLRELRRQRLNSLVTLPDNALIEATSDTEWVPLNSTQLPLLSSAELYSTTGVVKLPAFGSNISELFIGSIIERKFDSRDLYVTTFMLCHDEVLHEKNAAFDPQHASKWLKLQSSSQKVQYSQTGARNNRNNFICKISNFHGGKTYSVKGHFVPNKLSVDSNANSKVDILRCPMRKSKYSIDDLSGSIFEVSVEILLGKKSLVIFRIPWKTRRVGYMMTAPKGMSQLNMWGNLATRTKEINETVGPSQNDVHLCVPGFESPMSKRSLAVYAEFLQHHINVGFQHIHVAAAYKWGETNMDLFTESFQGYVSDGLLSIVSMSGDADRVPGFLGLSVDRDVVKVIFVNMCLYLTKGMVDYLAVWDIDEYFIPQLPSHSIQEVIQSAESRQPLSPLPSTADPFELVDSWRGGRGWADGDGHPFCYLRLLSESLYRSRDIPVKSDFFYPWIGNRYKAGPEKDHSMNFEKAILPTRKIFQAGLHTGAGCKLDYPFSGCTMDRKEEFCTVDKHSQRYGYTIIREPFYNTTDFSFEQRFDGFIFNKDAKTLDQATEGFLFHVQIHRDYLKSDSLTSSQNLYVTRFYPSMLKGLRQRGMEIRVILPGSLKNPDEEIDELLGWREFVDQR